MPTRDTPWPDGTPCWVDLMSPDPDATRAFYGELFGWQFEIGDESTGFYSMASVGGHKVAGIGGMQLDHPPVWTTYLASSDCDATTGAVVRAGGTILSTTMDVLDFGRMAIVQDSSGGTFGLWQAGTHLGAGLTNEPGSVVWNELMTRDYGSTKDFYAAVFGYTYTEIGGGNVQYSTIEVDGHAIGGLGVLPPEIPEQVPPHWLVYFAVGDTDAVVDRTVGLGGAVQRAPEDMPYGRHAGLADAQGAGFAVITPVPAPS